MKQSRKSEVNRVLAEARSFELDRFGFMMKSLHGQDDLDAGIALFMMNRYQNFLPKVATRAGADRCSSQPRGHESVWNTTDKTAYDYLVFTLGFFERNWTLSDLSLMKSTYDYQVAALRFGLLRMIESELFNQEGVLTSIESRNDLLIDNANNRMANLLRILTHLSGRTWFKHVEVIAVEKNYSEKLKQIILTELCKAKFSKKLVLEKLAPDFLTKFFNLFSGDQKWFPIFATLILTGCRPVEVERGVLIRLDAFGNLVFVIKNAKGRGTKRSCYRTLTIPVAPEWGLALRDLIKACGPITVSQGAQSIADKLYKVAKNEQVSKIPGLSAYVFRHLFLSQCKNSTNNSKAIGCAAGHWHSKSQGRYSDRFVCRRIFGAPLAPKDASVEDTSPVAADIELLEETAYERFRP